MFTTSSSRMSFLVEPDCLTKPMALKGSYKKVHLEEGLPSNPNFSTQLLKDDSQKISATFNFSSLSLISNSISLKA
jgi:hypothetical protein